MGMAQNANALDIDNLNNYVGYVKRNVPSVGKPDEGCLSNSFRIGGDEFAWVVEGRAPIQLEPLAGSIIELVCEPIEVGGRPFEIGCGIGASLCREQAKDAETLFNQADAAMYMVKKTGRNGFALYRP
jgi:GGDEF domain-containing protein